MQRDPEADTAPTITRIYNGRQAEPRPVEIERQPFDPNPPTVTRVELRSHLEPPPESTDPFSDDALNRREPVPDHPGIYRRFDCRGREHFEITYLDRAGNQRWQQVKGDLDAAEDALSQRLDVLDGTAVPDA